MFIRFNSGVENKGESKVKHLLAISYEDLQLLKIYFGPQLSQWLREGQEYIRKRDKEVEIRTTMYPRGENS